MELYVNDLKSQIELSRQTHDFMGLFEDRTIPTITESLTTSAKIAVRKTATTPSTRFSPPAESETLPKMIQTTDKISIPTPIMKKRIQAAENKTVALVSDTKNTVSPPFLDIILMLSMTLLF